MPSLSVSHWILVFVVGSTAVQQQAEQELFPFLLDHSAVEQHTIFLHACLYFHLARIPFRNNYIGTVAPVMVRGRTVHVAEENEGLGIFCYNTGNCSSGRKIVVARHGCCCHHRNYNDRCRRSSSSWQRCCCCRTRICLKKEKEKNMKQNIQLFFPTEQWPIPKFAPMRISCCIYQILRTR